MSLPTDSLGTRPQHAADGEPPVTTVAGPGPEEPSAGPGEVVLSTRDLSVWYGSALALKGVKYRATGAASILRRNLLVYGLGGVIAPFVGIKAIDLLLGALGLV